MAAAPMMNSMPTMSRAGMKPMVVSNVLLDEFRPMFFHYKKKLSFVFRYSL